MFYICVCALCSGAITHYTIPMDQILDTTIINPSGMDTTAFGSVELVQGVRGQAVKLDGKNSYIRIAGPGHRYECFGDLDMCPMGELQCLIARISMGAQCSGGGWWKWMCGGLAA